MKTSGRPPARVVLDGNVFLSGVFFDGVPGRIPDAWQDGRVALILSPAILSEYQRAGAEIVLISTHTAPRAQSC